MYKRQYVVIIGDEEIAKGQAVIRDMATSEQQVVAFTDVVSYLEGRLANA